MRFCGKIRNFFWNCYYFLDSISRFVTRKSLWNWKILFKDFSKDVFIFLTPWLKYCHKTLRLANQNFEKCLTWRWFSTSSRSRKDYSYLYVNFNIFGYMTIKTMKYYHNGEQTSLFLTGMVGMMKALNVQEEKRDDVLKEIYKKLRANFYLKLFQYLDGPITTRPVLGGSVLVENTSSDSYGSVRYELDHIEEHFYRVARLVVSRRSKIDFQQEIQKLPLDTALDYLLQDNIEFTNSKGNVRCFDINKGYLLNKIKEKLGQIQLNEQLGNLNGLDLLV